MTKFNIEIKNNEVYVIQPTFNATIQCDEYKAEFAKSISDIKEVTGLNKINFQVFHG